MKLSAIMRSGFLTKTEEARNSGVFEKAKAAFGAALPFICGNQLLVGKYGWLQDIRSHNPTRVAKGLLGDLLLVDRDRGHDLPLLAHRTGTFAGPPFPPY